MEKRLTLPDDFLASLGALALGSRLKRLADTLYRDVSGTLDASFCGIAPNHMPILACLDRDGSQTVTEITRRLGVSQPAVTRMVGALKDLDLVRLEPVSQDQRQSRVALSHKGLLLVGRMRIDYWPAVDAGAASLFAGAKGDFLAQIAFVEEALQRQPLAERVRLQASKGGGNATREPKRAG